MRAQNRVQEVRELRVERIPAHRKPALIAVRPGMCDPRFPQHTKVLGQGGFRDGDSQAAARHLPNAIKLGDNRQPGRITERVQHSRQIELATSQVLHPTSHLPLCRDYAVSAVRTRVRRRVHLAERVHRY
jgi:hypothetical protein